MKMGKRRIFIILLVVPGLFLFATTSVSNFAGTWSYSTATTEFQLVLSQNKDNVTGGHCSVQRNGNRIDCGVDNTEQSISGIANSSDSVVVNFKSFTSGSKGRAVIKKISPTTIDWKITQKPEGIFYVPVHAVMTLQ